MINIEKSIICTVLENDFILCDDRIIKHNLDANIFSDKEHRFLVMAINRLKELDEPANTDTLVYKLQAANKWNFILESKVSEIISHNPFGSYDLFFKYYNFLKKEHESKKMRESMYI